MQLPWSEGAFVNEWWVAINEPCAVHSHAPETDRSALPPQDDWSLGFCMEYRESLVTTVCATGRPTGAEDRWVLSAAYVVNGSRFAEQFHQRSRAELAVQVVTPRSSKFPLSARGPGILGDCRLGG